MKKTGDYHLSKDITQESFARLLRSYGPNEQSSSLLYTIARNTLLDHIKKTKQYELSGNNHHDATLDPEKNQMIKEAYQEVLAALTKLNEDEKEVLLLAASGDLSYRKIAEITGTSLANVKIRIHRARIKLKEIIIKENPNGVFD